MSLEQAKEDDRGRTDCTGGRMANYTSRGLRLRYERAGAGQPVVLLHGLSNHCLAWASQLDALAAAGWEAILPDLAGHGRSDAVATTTTTQDLAADVVALLDVLEIPAAPVCGLSLGGMVAQQLLVDYPDRISAALIASAGPNLTFPGADQVIASWNAIWLGSDGPRRRLEATWEGLASEAYRTSPHGQAFYTSWWNLLGGVSGQSLASVATGLLSFDVTTTLATVRVPVLAVAGEHDRLAVPPMVQQVAAKVPGARVAVIDDVQHLVNQERPDRFNELLLDLLAMPDTRQLDTT
jgi:3-oxoadipate enol-lactonase